MAGDFSVKGENANNVIDIDDNDCNTTKIEKQIAIDTPVINNYINNFYSKVSDVDMKQG